MTSPTGGTGQESGNANGGQGQEPGQQQEGQQAGTGQEPNAQQQASTGPEGLDLSTITDPAVRAYVEAQQTQAAEARREAARYRTERNALQTTAEQQRQAGLSAEQQAQEARQQETARLQALEQENRDLKVNGAVTVAATNAMAHDPATVLALIGSQITLGADGRPTNLDSLLAALKVDKPFLFRRTRGADAGAGNESGGNPTGNMNDGIRSALRGRRGQAQAL